MSWPYGGSPEDKLAAFLKRDRWRFCQRQGCTRLSASKTELVCREHKA